MGSTTDHDVSHPERRADRREEPGAVGRGAVAPASHSADVDDRALSVDHRRGAARTKLRLRML